MIRLVLVELSRLRARRAVVLLLAAAVVVPAVIAVGLVISTSPPSQAELDRIDAQVQAETERPQVQRQLQRCLADPERFGIVGDDVRTQCEESFLPQPEWFASYDTLDLVDEREFGSGIAVVALVGVIMFLVGTTFAGHDWNTGSMSNQLLFEPRRIRVWVAKAVAVTLVSVVVAGLVSTAYWLGLDAVLRSRDMPPGDGVLLDTLQYAWRGTALAGVGGLGGVMLTMLSRSTVFSLGMLFAVSAVGGLLLAAVGPRDPGWLDPTINAFAVVEDGHEYDVEVPASCFDNRTGEQSSAPGCISERTRSAGEGSVYYGALVLLVGGASLLSFRRRDVG